MEKGTRHATWVGIVLLVAIAAVVGTRVEVGNNADISWEGRTLTASDNTVQYDWPCVRAEFRVVGVRDVIAEMNGGHNEFVVLVDGHNVTRFTTSNTLANYTLIKGMTTTNHTITLIKITEASYVFWSYLMPLTRVSFHSLYLSGPSPTLLQQAAGMKTAARRKIEVFSDSDSNGFGIDGPDDTACLLGLVKYENCYQGYASLLGRMLDAEVHIEAWSGKGVVKNAVSFTNIDEDVMPIYWNRTLATAAQSLWNFAQWVPDVIIVLLGSNDYYSWPYPTDDEFISGYLAMLTSISSSYAGKSGVTPTIINLCGGAIANLQAPCPNVQKAALKFGATMASKLPPHPSGSYSHFVSIESNWLKYPQDFGCLDHRNVVGQQKLAAKLAPAIRRIMGW